MPEPEVTSIETLSSRDLGRTGGLVLAALAVLAGIVVFANSTTGDFVYDDAIQIVGNPLTQENQYVVKALTSDVWAFKGNVDQASSNYWRPTFTAWLILNHRLFGIGRPFGWHVTNILLHAVAIALCYAVLRKLGVVRWLAGGIALVFAVHPVHVESVAWISGSPDLLLAATLLGSLCFLLPFERRMTAKRWAGAILCFALALLSKEVAILFPLIVLAGAMLYGSGRRRDRLLDAVALALPFVVLAILYLAARVVVLGDVQKAQVSAANAEEMVLSWPSVGLFYLRQVFLPLWLGPSYPLRAVSLESFSLSTILLPTLLAVAAGVAAVMVSWRHRVRVLGLLIFVLMLAPAMNIRVFTPEQIVHDRYLYLPLLGLLMVAAPALAQLVAKGLHQARSAQIGAFALLATLSVPLAWQTWTYSDVWKTEVALWTRGVEIDPTSMFNQSQLGVFLNRAGRVPEARAALDRAIELKPLPEAYQPNAYLERAEIAISQQRFEEAEADLLAVLDKYEAHFGAHERLAVCYERWGRPAEAERVLREARDRIPHRRVELTDRLAIVLHQRGLKQQALAELESVRDDIDREYGPLPKLVLFHLGMLRLELGQTSEGRAALEAYLEATAGAGDEISRRNRQIATEILGRL